jgi:hypothetical protein
MGGGSRRSSSARWRSTAVPEAPSLAPGTGRTARRIARRVRRGARIPVREQEETAPLLGPEAGEQVGEVQRLARRGAVGEGLLDPPCPRAQSSHSRIHRSCAACPAVPGTRGPKATCRSSSANAASPPNAGRCTDSPSPSTTAAGKAPWPSSAHAGMPSTSNRAAHGQRASRRFTFSRTAFTPPPGSPVHAPALRATSARERCITPSAGATRVRVALDPEGAPRLPAAQTPRLPPWSRAAFRFRDDVRRWLRRAPRKAGLRAPRPPNADLRPRPSCPS